MVVSTGRGSLPARTVAALTSQPYQPSAPAQCLAFWYQLSTGTPGERRDPPRVPRGTPGGVRVPHGTAPDTLCMAAALGRLPRRLRGGERGAEEGAERECHGGGRLAPRPRHRPGGRRLAGETGQGGRGPRGGEGDRPVVPTCPPLRQAIFEAVGAGGDHGYIALDDLHVSDGACPEPGESPCRGDTGNRPGGTRGRGDGDSLS